MDAEARRAREQMKKLPFKEKLKNFWFYYKIHIFVAVLMIVVFGSAVVQCMRQVNYDLKVSYYGAQPVTSERRESLEKFLQDNSIDVTNNQNVEVIMPVYVGNINSALNTSETITILVKLQAEIVANENPAIIVDEVFKDFIIEGYPDSYDKVLDMSKVPELRTEFGLDEDEKLYWISMIEKENQGNILNSFDNADGIERWIEKNME